MTDALERLKKRERPNVSPRNSDAVNGEQESQETVAKRGISTPRHQDAEVDKSQLAGVEKALETKASTLRLEVGIAKDLLTHCKEREINRESLVEALYVYYKSHQEIQEAVLADATQRASRRQELGNRRRARTMMERFGS